MLICYSFLCVFYSPARCLVYHFSDCLPFPVVFHVCPIISGSLVCLVSVIRDFFVSSTVCLFVFVLPAVTSCAVFLLFVPIASLLPVLPPEFAFWISQVSFCLPANQPANRNWKLMSIRLNTIICSHLPSPTSRSCELYILQHIQIIYRFWTEVKQGKSTQEEQRQK